MHPPREMMTFCNFSLFTNSQTQEFKALQRSIEKVVDNSEMLVCVPKKRPRIVAPESPLENLQASPRSNEVDGEE